MFKSPDFNYMEFSFKDAGLSDDQIIFDKTKLKTMETYEKRKNLYDDFANKIREKEKLANMFKFLFFNKKE